MKRPAVGVVLGTAVIISGAAAVLMGILEIWGIRTWRYTFDGPYESIRSYIVAAILQCVFAGANVEFGLGLRRRRTWARVGFIAWTGLWSGLYFFGTLAGLYVLDLRASSHVFVLYLALSLVFVFLLPSSRTRKPSAP
jgi:uncharacterized membrane protein